MNYYSKGITKEEAESIMQLNANEQTHLRDQYRVQEVNLIISLINSLIKRHYSTLLHGSFASQIIEADRLDSLMVDIIEKSYTDFTVRIYLPNNIVQVKLANKDWEYPIDYPFYEKEKSDIPWYKRLFYGS